MKMNKKLAEELELTFKDIEVSTPEDTKIEIFAHKEQVLTILRFLKDKGYNHLALISCVDWIEKAEFELVYILTPYLQDYEAYKEIGDIHLKMRIPRENPEFETVIPIFANAEPYEREIHELFGIKFAGHPRLTHLLLERDYAIPPFRKDFDTREYVKDVFDSIPPIKGEKK
ncbi:NADH-quinone oxidoreductase subunit C [candidate division WOR-3 bacterium]|nr:NADH-quinone oxidoreductase subunit C [candidate division WOR-3 bacterium]